MISRYLIGAGLLAVAMAAFWLFNAGGNAARDQVELDAAETTIETYERIEDALSGNRGADWSERLHEWRDINQ